MSDALARPTPLNFKASPRLTSFVSLGVSALPLPIKLPYKLPLYLCSLSQRHTAGVESQMAHLAVGRLASFYGRRFAASVTGTGQPLSILFPRCKRRDRWTSQRSLLYDTLLLRERSGSRAAWLANSASYAGSANSVLISAEALKNSWNV